MYKFFTLFLAFTFAFGSLLAQPLAVENLDLGKAISIALENNYRIKLSKERVTIALNNNTPGNAGKLPTINAGATSTRASSNLRQEFSDASRPAITSNGASVQNLNANLTLNWVLFDGFKMFANTSRLKLLGVNSQDALQANIQNMVAAVASAYYNILQQKSKEKVLAEAVALGEIRLTLAKNKYEVGSGSKLDFLNAQVDLNTDKSNLLRQKALSKQAEIDLNNLLSRNPKTRFSISDSIVAKAGLSEESFIASAKSQNLNLVVAKRNKEIAYQDLRILQSNQYPTFSLGAGYQVSDVRNSAGLFKRNYSGNTQAGFTASWNLFNGFNNKRLIANQKITENINQLRTDSLWQELEADLYQAFVNYNNGLELLDLEAANQEVAKQNVSIANDRCKIGVATSLEFREAQRNLIATQSRFIEASYQAKVAEIEIYRLSNSPYPFFNK